MMVIFAEKDSVGKKIAAALGGIYLKDSGKIVSFGELPKYKKLVDEQGNKDGCFKVKFKGEDCYVTWVWGHMCGLKQAKDYNPEYKYWSKMPVPFFPKKYELKVTDEKHSRQLKIIKSLFEKCDWIINATDADREGEVIFAYVYQYLNCKKPFKRVLFSELTKSGIPIAFDSLVDSSERKNIENAGRARAMADWVVGANLTARLTLHNHSTQPLSVGRVQTATLNLLVQRELSIRDFKPSEYFTLDGVFTTSKGEKYKGVHKLKKFDKKEDAEKIFDKINGKKGEITVLKKEKKNVPVPELLNQAALQMKCNEKFGLKMIDTLDIAQYLYSEGYTTYPRTSSRYLGEDMKEQVNGIFDKLEATSKYEGYIKGKPRPFFMKRFFDNTKVGSHCAIIPTGETPKGLTELQQKVYDVICRSFIQMIYPEAVVENTNMVTTVEDEEYISTGKIIAYKGWMEVSGVPKVDTLPDVSLHEIVDPEFKIESKWTKPPQRYTDKTLLAAMLSAGKTITNKELRDILSDPKDGGIGTEATRASIVETIIQRGYAERDGKSFVATEKGIDLIQKLPVDDLKSAEITAEWEKRLREIADGKEDLKTFMIDIYRSVTKWCKEIDSSPVISTSVLSGTSSSLEIKCPICGQPLKKMKWGWGCSGYKTGCKFSVSQVIAKKKLTDLQVKKLVNEGKTSSIAGFVSKAGKKFSAKLYLDENQKVQFEFANSKSKTS